MNEALCSACRSIRVASSMHGSLQAAVTYISIVSCIEVESHKCIINGKVIQHDVVCISLPAGERLKSMEIRVLHCLFGGHMFVHKTQRSRCTV